MEKNAEAVASIESYENLTVADMPQLEVREGMLYFDNSEQYFKTIAIVSKMTDEELDKWEQGLGFVSLRTMQNKAYSELDKAKTREEIEQIVNNNKSIFRIIKNKESEEEIIELIEIPEYQAICNKDGLFVEDVMLTKIHENYSLHTNIKNKEDIRSLSNNDIEHYKKDKNYIVNQYVIDSKIEEVKNKSKREIHNKDRNHGWGYYQNNYRRCYIEFKAIREFSVDYTYTFSTTRYFATVMVYGKKRVAGVYIRYKTNLTLFDAYFDVVGEAGISYEVDLPKIDKNNTRSIYRSYYYGQIIMNGPMHGPDFYFRYYGGEASSRGVGTGTIKIVSDL